MIFCSVTSTSFPGRNEPYRFISLGVYDDITNVIDKTDRLVPNLAVVMAEIGNGQCFTLKN
ncbi:MAG: hypothetical protein BGO80_00415 [Devosia sp. 63-57]|nr:MAG: hypothetical protein ABS74_10795 [Pelagibacterium sp. SCN 63-126]OJX44097.1 MAG: hypothetical protein BGO80_00415 [Devosia sp. 63-57]